MFKSLKRAFTATRADKTKQFDEVALIGLIATSAMALMTCVEGWSAIDPNVPEGQALDDYIAAQVTNEVLQNTKALDVFEYAEIKDFKDALGKEIQSEATNTPYLYDVNSYVNVTIPAAETNELRDTFQTRVGEFDAAEYENAERGDSIRNIIMPALLVGMMGFVLRSRVKNNLAGKVNKNHQEKSLKPEN